MLWGVSSPPPHQSLAQCCFSQTIDQLHSLTLDPVGEMGKLRLGSLQRWLSPCSFLEAPIPCQQGWGAEAQVWVLVFQLWQLARGQGSARSYIWLRPGMWSRQGHPAKGVSLIIDAGHPESYHPGTRVQRPAQSS